MFQNLEIPSYAGFWIRVLAYVLDAIILSIVTVPLAFVLGLIMTATGTDQDPLISMVVNLGINAFSIIATWLYDALLESSSWQATIGKKALGLRVTDLDGHRISFGRATGRYFGKILSGVICGIGFIMVAFTEKKQGLHDMLANTLVLKGPPTETIYQPPPPPDFAYRGPGY